jgi:hypothetical protein
MRGPTLSFSSTVQRAPCSISGTIMSGWVLPVRQLEASGDAPRDQGKAGFKLRFPSILDEDGTLEEDAIALPSFAPDARGLNHDGVRLYGH